MAQALSFIRMLEPHSDAPRLAGTIRHSSVELEPPLSQEPEVPEMRKITNDRRGLGSSRG